MKQLKIWLVVALIFVAGFSAGVVTTRTVTRRVIRAAIAHPELVRDRIERKLDRELKLDARQAAEVHQTMLRSHEQLKELRREFHPRLRAILGDTRRNISSVLTPEQQKRFEKFQAEYPLPRDAAGD